MATHSYLRSLDAIVGYTLKLAAGEQCTCPGNNPTLELEIKHIIATVRAAQENKCGYDKSEKSRSDWRYRQCVMEYSRIQ